MEEIRADTIASFQADDCLEGVGPKIFRGRNARKTMIENMKVSPV